MSNSKKTLLERRSVRIGTVSKFALPPVPDFFPQQFIDRFPELSGLNNEMQAYFEKLNNALEQTVSGSNNT